MVDSDPTVQELRAEVERLKEELSSSTNHYNGIINDLVKLRDEARTEVEKLREDYNIRVKQLEKELAQAISARTPHDYGLLKEQRDHYRERLGAAAKEVFELKAELLTKERHIEDLQKAAVTNLTAAVALVRPEPSRLEIAALLASGLNPCWNFSVEALFHRTDAIIAAAKEVTK